MTTTLEEAIDLIKEKRLADAPIATYEDLPVTKGVGRFGPFIKWNGLFINVSKKYDYDALTDQDIAALIELKSKKRLNESYTTGKKRVFELKRRVGGDIT